MRGPLLPSEAHNAADPNTVDPIAAALGADRPTWHEREAPVPTPPGDPGPDPADAADAASSVSAGPSDPADRA